jgi:hypothetical protein
MNTMDMILVRAPLVGGVLLLALGVTTWYRQLALATQGESLRKPRRAAGISIIDGLIPIGSGIRLNVTEIV